MIHEKEKCSFHYWILWYVNAPIQTRCTILTDVRNFTEANVQTKCSKVIYSSETELKVAKKFKTRLCRINKIQIHQKFENLAN